MRIYTKAGDLAFKSFAFPDGQPHFKLETYDREFNEVTVELSIKSPRDLFLLVLVCAVLRQHGYSQIQADIRYLMGARMDRAIDWSQPFTLESVARIINSCGFSRVRILDVHSEVATRLIRNSVNVLPFKVVEQVMVTVGGGIIICPDEGAKKRTTKLAPMGWEIDYCGKHRDLATGTLSGFYVGVASRINGQVCTIIDDICDGGGTFTGLSKVLREAGATKVNLFCTHGVFSKGLPLEGIDKVFTTDSYCDYATGREFKSTVVIPISMKELV